MDSNTHSISQAPQLTAGRPDELAPLAAAVQDLAAQDVDRLTDAVLAEQVLALRGLVDRLEGHWLQQLAAVDARGVAGADQGQEVGSTAAWLRTRRSEEHTSELQSLTNLVCRLLLEKKKNIFIPRNSRSTNLPSPPF